MKQSRIATIQDISCFGRCSLTVALPIISAAGIETSCIPTAVLSTHTGGFKNFTYRDLTSDIKPIAKHWKELNLSFDAIYTGYLGSLEQIQLVADFIDDFNNNSLIVVDPAMADNGELYSGFSMDFPKAMATLCKKADLLIPNLTEAAFILNEPYLDSNYTKEYIEDILIKLSDLGPKHIILTGVSFKEGELGAACYDANTKQTTYYFSEYIDGHYHGTGDVFSSAVLAALMNSLELSKAMEIAVEFTVDAIRRSYAQKTDPRYGVNFEESIPKLLKLLNKY